MSIKNVLKYAIPRGIVYHKISEDIFSLWRSIFSRLNDINKIRQFENLFAEYIGRKYAIAFPFARTSIYYSLKIKNFPVGSEILMPPITIKAILDVIIDLGMKPVFVDIDPNTLCFDKDALVKSVNSKTKAILVTYLFGIVPNIEVITCFCKQFNLFIIEDFSQCLNGRYKGKKLGSFGDVGVYSASSIKTLDTYGGGLLVCDDEMLYKLLRQAQSELKPPSRMLLVKKIVTDLIRNIATHRLVFHLFVFPCIKLVSKLNPESVLKHSGVRRKNMIHGLPVEWFTSYTSFQAELGVNILDGIYDLDEIRVNNVDYIKSITANIEYPSGVKHSENIYWQFVFYSEHPIEMQGYLQKMNIDTSTTSLEMISSLSKYPYQSVTPNARKLYRLGLFIPSYPGLRKNELRYIADVLKSASAAVR